MNVTKVEFLGSAVRPDQYPSDALPEIALAGRSNVGKSSLINCMVMRKKLAHISSKPGKTRTINFYQINDRLIFADVPGYGFAQVSKEMRASWGKMMETYFTKRKSLKAVVQLVDVRHPPTKDDQTMYQFLKYYKIPVIVVATKVDKIPRGKWQKHEKMIRETLELAKEDPLILFSAETRQGREELWKAILEKINE